LSVEQDPCYELKTFAEKMSKLFAIGDFDSKYLTAIYAGKKS
jgi:hypothetical protein